MIQSIFGKLMLRFTGVILLIIFILSISLTYLFQDYYFQTKEAEFIAMGQKIASIAAQSAEQGNFFYNMAMTQVQRSLQDFVEENVLLANREGVILAASVSEGWLGLKLDSEFVSPVLNGKVVSVRGNLKYFKEPILLVAVPVQFQSPVYGAQVVGAVLVYNSIAGISGTILKLRQMLFYIGLAVLIIAVLLSYQFSRSISNPIQEVGLAAISMSEGDYSTRVRIQREDEIGQLAKNFNTMGEKLDAHVRLQREFVANVSHELKTPLTSIRGFVKALRDGVYEDEDSPREYCDIVMDEVDRMNRLVAELLDLSQIESGIIQFRLEAFDLTELVQRTVNGLSPIIAKGDYRVRVEMPEGLPQVLGDFDRIGQVLINLIRNALKHSEPGAQIRVRARQVEEMVRVDVIDEGCGIPAEELEHIWSRFHKVDKARTRSTEEGTGLGLSIAREIIERHGGKVGVESMLGKGSTFSFTLRMF